MRGAGDGLSLWGCSRDPAGLGPEAGAGWGGGPPGEGAAQSAGGQAFLRENGVEPSTGCRERDRDTERRREIDTDTERETDTETEPER